MKRLILAAASALLQVAYAYSVEAAPPATPVVNLLAKPMVTHSPTTDVRVRLMNQMRLVSMGLKSGKITPQQAQDLRASLKNIHKQQASYLRASANHQFDPRPNNPVERPAG